MSPKEFAAAQAFETSPAARRESVVDQYGRRSSAYGTAVANNASRRSSVMTQAEPAPAGTLTQSNRKWSSVVEKNDDFNDMAMESEAQANRQNQMGILEGLRTYPTAAAWSVLLASAIIMEGYDTSLIGSFFAYKPFNDRYGTEIVNGEKLVSAPWQTGLQNASQVGSIIGLTLNGIMADMIGYKKTMLIALVAMTAAIFIPFFAPNIHVLLVGQVLSGIPWGIFQTLSIAYASEVCPTPLRSALTSYVNVNWVMGQVLASGVLKGLLNNQTEWAYRIPFAIQWVFPPIIGLGVLFAPESPWWLVRHNRLDDAMVSVRRLQSSSEGEETVANTVSMMRLTNEQEKVISEGTSYWACFKGTDLRRTEISCITWACQSLCGSSLMGWSTVFFEQAGLSQSNAFTFSMIQYVLGLVGTVISWSLMARYGRRTIYITGLCVLLVLLVVIGALGFVSGTSAQWAVGSLLLVFAMCYNSSVGPVCYAIVGEMSSTRLRQKTVALARITYNIIGLVNNTLLPLQLNPGAWNWGAKTGLFWAGITLVCLVWCVFRLPEAKARSYAELNLLFENRVPAWKFSSTKVDAFRSESMTVKAVEVESDDEKKVEA